MKVIKDTIGGTTVFIQAVDDELQVINEPRVDRATKPTGIEDKLTDAYTKLKSVLRGIAEDISADVKSIEIDKRPKELEIEFNLSMSTQAGIWVVSGQGDCAFRVRMTWDLSNETKSNA